MSKKETTYDYQEVVLENGASFCMWIPENALEEIWDEFMAHWENGSIWCCENWCDLKIEYGLHQLSFVDCKKIIGVR